MEKTGYKIFVAAGIAFLIAAAVIMVFVLKGNTQVFDQGVTNRFVAHRSAGLTTLMEGITYLGEWEIIAALCLLLLVFAPSRVRLGIPVSLCGIFTMGLRVIVKPLVQRARPDESLRLIEESGYSFPSGHAITSIGVMLLLLFLLWYYRKRGLDYSKKEMSQMQMLLVSILLVFLAFAIGISRIYLGVHFLTDVLGGWCAGLGVAFILAGFVIYFSSTTGNFTKIRKLLKKVQNGGKSSGIKPWHL